MKKMKIINDIRLFQSNTENIDGNSNPSSFHNKFLAIVTRRVAMKLRENNFSLGDFDHLYINFTTCKVPNNLKLADRSIDKYHSWYRYFDYQVKDGEIEEILLHNNTEKLLNMLEKVLITLFTESEESKEIVKSSIKSALEDGEKMLFRFKERKSGNITAIIYLRLLNNGFYFPLLKVINTDNNILLDIDLDKTLTCDQFGQILLSRSKVEIVPRKNVFSKDLKPLIFHL